MTLTEANKIVKDYYSLSKPGDDDNFIFLEALSFIVNETKNPRAMLDLGGWYYGKKEFDLALKYYEMAAEYKDPNAYNCLGYIWYYGRTGEKDYEKAFRYYSLAAKAGITEAAYKVADMYKNGYYVEKDYEKYKSIIEEIYLKIKDETRLFEPVPQICIRLARIRLEEGKVNEAISLYTYAKDFLAQRLRINNFFGDLTNMKWLISELYKLTDVNINAFDFYDLYQFLSSPCKISFKYDGEKHLVESVEEEGECAVCFDGKWYRSRDDFFNKASINNKMLTEIYDDLYLFEVI